MLLTICVLQVWRFTGVPLHEWLGVIVALAVFVHLLMQRAWVMAHVRNVRSWAVVLNALLFIAFTIASVSGIAMSKVLFPRGAPVTEYLKWHELHDTSSKLVLLLLGLHIALNWNALRRLRAFRFHIAARYAAALLLAALVVATAAYGVKQILPAQTSVLLYTPNGRVQPVPPPPELAMLRTDQHRPDPAAGARKLVVTFLLLGGITLLGRHVLRLRL